MLTTKEIKKQMHLGNIIIHNLGQSALNKPNSCDIRLGDTLYSYDYQILDSSKGACFLEEVINDQPVTLRKHKMNEDGFLLEPHKVYLTKSIEEIETHGYIPMMTGKVAMSLLGVSIELNNGFKTDEYKGNMLLTIIATKPTIIYPDMPIGNVCFFPSLKPSSDTRKIRNSITYGAYKTGMLTRNEILEKMKGGNPDIYIDNKKNIVINPNSINLTLNEEIGLYTNEILDIKQSNHIEKKNIKEIEWFSPEEIYLARTNEWTETQNLVPMMSGRSSLGRLGVHVHCSAGMGSIGYKGYWHMGIRPTKPIKLEKDLKCCQIYYYHLDGEIDNTYDGYMQNLSKDELGSQMYKIMQKKK